MPTTTTTDDQHLLAQYARTRAPEAFAALVHRSVEPHVTTMPEC